MESSNKQIKEQLNEALQSSCTSEDANEPKEKISETSANFSKIFTDISLEKNVGTKYYDRIKDIFEKTEAMKEAAKEKNQQLEQQFTFLKQRLSSSSEYLMRIKKNIENIKFSYQKNVIEMHNVLDPSDYLDAKKYSIGTREDMAKHMEDIRKKIDDLQTRMTAQREKQQYVTESYQAAFDRVVDALQQIEDGSYSSQGFKVIKD